MAKANAVKAKTVKEQVKCNRCGVVFSRLLHERLEVSGPNGNVSIHRSCRAKGDKVVDSRYFGDVREDAEVAQIVEALTSGPEVELNVQGLEAAAVFAAVNSIARGEA